MAKALRHTSRSGTPGRSRSLLTLGPRAGRRLSVGVGGADDVVIGYKTRQRDSRVHIELCEYAPEVAVDRVGRDEQLLGHLAIRVTLGYKPRDGQLGVGHRCPARPSGLPG